MTTRYGRASGPSRAKPYVGKYDPADDGCLTILEQHLRDLDRQEPWRQRAACKNMGHKKFFPERGKPSREAKAICAQCPVKKQCKSFAQRSGSDYGVWGGEVRSRGPGSTRD